MKGKSRFIKDKNGAFVNIKELNKKTKHRKSKKRGGGLPDLNLKQISEEFKKQFPDDKSLRDQIQMFLATIGSMYDKDTKEEGNDLIEVSKIKRILFAVIQKLNDGYPHDYLNGDEYIDLLETLDGLYKALNDEQKKFLKQKFDDLHKTFSEAEGVLQVAKQSDVAKEKESQSDERLSKRTVDAIQMKEELQRSLQSGNLDDDFKRSITKIFKMIENKENVDRYVVVLNKLVEIIPILISSNE